MADKNSGKPNAVRLDRFLAEMGHGSRSQIKDMAKKGRIQVNGQVVKATDLKVRPDFDQVTVDGAAAKYAVMEYYMLNKPQGVVSARTDSRYETVVELIGEALRSDLFPVGRLDVDTEGLLLITNDGDLAHNLLSPGKHVDKVYMARLSGILPEDAAKRLENGLLLEDGTRALPARLSFEPEGPLKLPFALEEPLKLSFAPEEPPKAENGPAEVFLTIREGKFHQVKRMFEMLGCHVVYLKRLSMGSLVLDPDLGPGEYRPLREDEIRMLKGARSK